MSPSFTNSNGRIFLFVAFFAACVLATRAQNQPTIGFDELQNGKSVSLSDSAWKYKAGDREEWAAKDFADDDWKSITNNQINEDLSSLENWKGRAWFRQKITVDERLAGVSMAWRMWQWGASEVYLDGKLMQSYGEIKADGDVEYNPRGLVLPIVFESAGMHTIAVRYSFQAMGDLSTAKAAWLARGGVRPGFLIAISEPRDALLRFENRARSERVDYIFVGVLWSLALIHFLLFAFYRAAPGNLFYSFFVTGLGATILLSNVTNTAHFSATAYVLCDVVRISLQSLAILALLAFLYVEFNRRFSAIFWMLLAFWLIVVALQWARLKIDYDYTLITLVLSLADALRIMFTALKKRREGAWIIAVGIALFVVGIGFNIAFERKIFVVSEWFYNLNLYSAILTVPLTVSLYLARNFARTNQNLAEQLEQVRELSARQLEQERREVELRLAHERTKAENERRARELEEAQQLQLSMLPKKLPNIAGLEIAAYMKPATEVGGDYYDFHVSADGTLTVAVGDATGHGLKAGSVVTATKSLFNAFAEQTDIPQIFRQTSGALKKMNLRGLFMAMAMLKIKDSKMTLSIAGMPSILIYRAAGKMVEEISLRAMPLGSFSKFEYQQDEIALSSGDCVVLMSDGFPEMFNEKDEMLGFERAAEILPDIAHHAPAEIIGELIKVGEDWAGTRPPDDDVTFVVLKIT